ncbi:hypothetical protein [Rhizobium rhizogenes]|uniref:hypothetical protein n=1 Tax=Rhizobium rhizogenes TaxID=359 RepID=UPI0022CAD153|nr:hypothetical protein [Rhizobium rhizogenes]MCZ7486418.1 hypothetical protein [Rhizobium rhizogenes]
MARENASYLHGRDAPKTETATQARQGSRGRPVLVILIVSVLLALVVWAVVEYSVFEPDENRPQSTQTETAPVPQPSGSGSFDNNPANGGAAPPASTDTNPTRQDSTGAPQNP